MMQRLYKKWFRPTGFWTDWAAWTPTRTGWTDVGGAPTVTARFCQIGSLIVFQEKIVPIVTVAVVAGTGYTSLPVAAGASGMGGVVSMMNATTLVATGVGVIDVANSRCFPPSQGATGNTLIIFGAYEV